MTADGGDTETLLAPAPLPAALPPPMPQGTPLTPARKTLTPPALARRGGEEGVNFFIFALTKSPTAVRGPVISKCHTTRILIFWGGEVLTSF